MPLFGGADKLTVAGVHQIPNLPKLSRDAVGVFLRSLPSGGGFILDLLTVFIRTGQVVHIISLESAVSGDGVGDHCFIGVPEVGNARGVGDRRRDIKFAFIHINLTIISK